MSKSGIVFNETDHTYTMSRTGRVLPSVTEIIGQYKTVRVGGDYYNVDTMSDGHYAFPAEMLNDVADIGTAIHKGCAILNRGELLDWDSLPSDVEPALRQYEKWLRVNTPFFVHIEQPFYSAEEGFAGTPDMVCKLFSSRTPLAIIDIKTGKPGRATGAQLAAYEWLLREHMKQKIKSRKVIKRYALHLPKDGKEPKLIPYEGCADLAFFKARFDSYRYLRGDL